MYQYPHKSENGQAIIYLVLGFVVFLGFVALAIDGGMALSNRRHAQNAADASSLAGGGEAAERLGDIGLTYDNWSCYSNTVGPALWEAEDAAETRATSNNFTIDVTNDPVGNNYVYARCNNGIISQRYIDVTVDISSTTPSNFLQLISPNAMQNVVSAITRVYPEHSFGFGNAIIALNGDFCSDPGSDGGIMYGNSDGSTDINIYGGGIFSNGCLRGNGQPTVTIKCEDPNPPHDWVDCTEGAYGNQVVPGNAIWIPTPDTITETIPLSEFNIVPPVSWNSQTGTCSVSGYGEGHYIKAHTLEQDLNHGAVTLTDGLWCVDGNLSINAGDELLADGITMYMLNGELTINGTPNVEIYAASDTTDQYSDLHEDDTGSAIKNVLIYVPPPANYPASCPNHTVKLNGSETSVFFGILLAPCGNIQLNGTGGNTYEGQVVGWDVNVGGGADLNLTYHGDDENNIPTSLFLYK